MKRAVYPGSFDPVTKGHLEVVQRVRLLVDELIVAVVHNPSKQGLFTLSERTALVSRSVAAWPEVRVDSFSGLLVDYVAAQQAGWIVKGLRSIADFEAELQMARLNRSMAGGIDTLFVPASEGHSYISSSFVREIAALGGDITSMVSAPVHSALQRKFGREEGGRG